MKIISLVILAVTFSSYSVFSQEEGAEEKVEIIKVDEVSPQERGEIFTIVETMPEFPGGLDSLFKFLGQNINYPSEAKNNGVEGIVYATFVVQKTGKVGDVIVLRGIGAGCDEEAKRVVEIMPNWTPGTQRGRKVNVQYNIPIRFKLGTGFKKGKSKKKENKK